MTPEQERAEARIALESNYLIEYRNLYIWLRNSLDREEQLQLQLNNVSLDYCGRIDDLESKVAEQDKEIQRLRTGIDHIINDYPTSIIRAKLKNLINQS